MLILAGMSSAKPRSSLTSHLFETMKLGLDYQEAVNVFEGISAVKNSTMQRDAYFEG